MLDSHTGVKIQMQASEQEAAETCPSESTSDDRLDALICKHFNDFWSRQDVMYQEISRSLAQDLRDIMEEVLPGSSADAAHRTLTLSVHRSRCDICMEDVPDSQMRTPHQDCWHKFCHDGLEEYVDRSVAAKQWLIRCPAAGASCTGRLSQNECVAVAGESEALLQVLWQCLMSLPTAA